MKATVAVGGNALLEKYDRGTAEEQINRAEITARKTINFLRENEVVITHGNGPQVGAILLQNEFSSSITPPMPLDVCGAMSQGSIGYFLQTSFQNVFNMEGVEKKVVTLITRTVVDLNDPAFKNPTKPIGKYYTKEEAAVLERNNGYVMREDSGRGYRRVVPSPDVVDNIEKDAIKLLYENDFIVIASGGGGIPVVKDEKGRVYGREAVIDKDLGAQLLASVVGGDIFVILTDVEGAYLNFGKPDQKLLRELTVSEAKKLLEQGVFGSGSMVPKVKAAVRFAERTGKAAYIGHLYKLKEILEEKSGTKIVPDKKQ
ncbi:MAG: carbamate kinase [Thermoplasmatales archaeon]